MIQMKIMNLQSIAPLLCAHGAVWLDFGFVWLFGLILRLAEEKIVEPFGFGFGGSQKLS